MRTAYQSLFKGTPIAIITKIIGIKVGKILNLILEM